MPLSHTCTRLLSGLILSASIAGNVSAQDEVKLGVLMGVTGPLANFIPPIQDAMQLAADEVNNNGGVLNGKKLTLVIGDTQAAAQGAVDAATKLVNVENVPAIVGGLASGATLRTMLWKSATLALPCSAGMLAAPMFALGQLGSEFLRKVTALQSASRRAQPLTRPSVGTTQPNCGCCPMELHKSCVACSNKFICEKFRFPCIAL